MNNPNQPQPNLNQFNPLLQGIFQGSTQWGQPATNPQGNQWGNQPPNQWGGQVQQGQGQQGQGQQGQQGQPGQQGPNNQWGNSPQVPNPNQNANQGWGANSIQNPKPNNEIVYPDLEYKPQINGNNNNSNPQVNPQGNNSNMDLPFQLIGGMQGLFKPANNNSQGGNPYQV
jgi:hypothetical protein